MSGGGPVLPISLAGKALEVSVSRLRECLASVCSVQVSAVGEIGAEFFWINRFSSWVNVDNYQRWPPIGSSPWTLTD